MVKLINSLTGTEMFVADDRKEEYLAAGHKLAVIPVAKKTEPTPVEPKKEIRKTPAKKTASSKRK